MPGPYGTVTDAEDNSMALRGRICQDGGVKSRQAQFGAPCRAVAEEAATMGMLSIVVGVFLFLVLGACAFSDVLIDGLAGDERVFS